MSDSKGAAKMPKMGRLPYLPDSTSEPMSKTAGHTATTPENWCQVASAAIKLVPGYTETNIPKELVDTYAVLMDACRDSQAIGERSGEFWLARHKELAAEFVQLSGLPEGSGTEAARKAFAEKDASNLRKVEALRDALRGMVELADELMVDDGKTNAIVSRRSTASMFKDAATRALALAEEQTK